MLSVADRLATRGAGAEEAIARHLELAREVIGEALRWSTQGRPPALVRGDELARALAIEPGPLIGELLAAIAEEAFAGEVRKRAGGDRVRRGANRLGCARCRTASSAGSSPASCRRGDRHEERAIAFMDINPATRGHALVIPRAHARDIHDIGAEDLAAVRGARRARRAAGARATLGAAGVNLLNSSGAAAWQTVFHFHLHVIPRYAGDPLRLPWTPAPGDPAEIAAAAASYARAAASFVWCGLRDRLLVLNRAMKKLPRGNRHDRRDARWSRRSPSGRSPRSGAQVLRAPHSGGTGTTGVSGASGRQRRHRRHRRDRRDRPGAELPELAVRGRQRDDRHAGQGRQVQRAADDPAQRHDRRVDDRAQPARRQPDRVLQQERGRHRPRPAISILSNTKGLDYQLVAQSPLVQLQPYFGETAQFALATTIPVQKGERDRADGADVGAGAGDQLSARTVVAREPPEGHLHQRRRGLDPDLADDRRLGRAVLTASTRRRSCSTRRR